MEQKWTQEPWETTGATLVYSKHGTVCACGAPRAVSYVKYVEPELGELDEPAANAARIVACVNACAGIENPAVELGALRQYQTDASRAIAELRAENERLTKCLKTANEQAEKFEREWYLRGDENERLRKALELIAGCQSRVPGDVVDIAQKALAGPKP